MGDPEQSHYKHCELSCDSEAVLFCFFVFHSPIDQFNTNIVYCGSNLRPVFPLFYVKMSFFDIFVSNMKWHTSLLEYITLSMALFKNTFFISKLFLNFTLSCFWGKCLYCWSFFMCSGNKQHWRYFGQKQTNKYLLCFSDFAFLSADLQI